ncbi:hypothetical protein AAVH_15256 [Aphelenchoides avenae]|nr:hypothetical protein AAVH_15256 [Aphelenchus avenae]
MRPTEAWSQICSDHLPCYARTTVETLEERRHLRYSSYVIPSSLAPAKAFAVEKFHVSSKTFRKRLALEMRYQLEPGTTGTERDGTVLLLPEFASDVLGFLDRVHIGPSLLASRDLRDLICQLKQRLPLHNLTCASFGSVRWYDGACWLTVRHFQRDLPYTNVRSFKMPSTAGNESDCALIRYYLSNSHVAELRAPEGDNFPFAIKMLACLAARNFSVGLMHLHARGQRLCDYRSMDAVFGGMRMAILHLSCDEQQFVGLVKTTDVFRMSAIQGLRAPKLTLHYRVDERYHSQWTHSHLRSIERKIVQICKEFESGKITDTVTHFEFRPRPPTEMNYAFSRDNLLVSKMKVEGMNLRDRINIFAWDVYRFRNASTGGYLTACVGRSAYSTESILHLVKGEVYPDASFVRY